MTKIDRYILMLYMRTLLICFSSLGGIFVVFHAFSNLEALGAHAEALGGFIPAMIDYYGPYLLVIFDSTSPILALMALLFTIGWLRQSGELTSILAVGVRHGRILRPMLIAAALIVVVGLFNREFLLPELRNKLGNKPSEIAGMTERPLQPCYDRQIGVLVEGKSLITDRQLVIRPAFRLFAEFPGFGNQLTGTEALWKPASGNHPAGFLMRGVTRPSKLDQLPTRRIEEQAILMTSLDNDWLNPGECFVATSVDIPLLEAAGSSKKYAPLGATIRRVRNPAVHTSSKVRVDLHSRLLRPLLDFSLVLLGLPLAVSRGEKNLFVVVGHALLLVAMFFGVKTLAGTLGASGYMLSPSMAAWVPILVLTPLAYSRYCSVQQV
ncbi:putative permease YjgP/YjgQ family protein [Roseimaritima multifibrata]|uniref:Putative permease YjgP/YjgQ family protein n=1 Tax=Roseimaritima multifibrata TaxID=1930274 RepID=A0A517MGS3_9BACT|nr:LptF/LptG family permease [Roseimaritima multifibrata]QDS94066.1 putative permease YjgP/YjgQ family protein [Roseimaritima multifibrata]